MPNLTSADTYEEHGEAGGTRGQHYLPSATTLKEPNYFQTNIHCAQRGGKEESSQHLLFPSSRTVVLNLVHVTEPTLYINRTLSVG